MSMTPSARRPKFPGDPWTFYYQGVLIGGDSPLVPTEVTGIGDMPEVKSYDIEMVSTDGSWAGQDWMRGRTITISFRVVAADKTNLDALMGEVTSAFTHSRTEQFMEFRVPGVAQGVSAKVRGRVRKREITVDGNYAGLAPKVDLEFVCTRPYIEATKDSTEPIRAGVWDKGGIPMFNVGDKFVFDQAAGIQIPNTAKVTDQKSALVTNGATTAAPIITEIRGPVEGGIYIESRDSYDSYADSSDKKPTGTIRGRVGLSSINTIKLSLGPEDVIRLDSGTKKAYLSRNKGRDEDITRWLDATQWFSAEHGRTILVSLVATDMERPTLYARSDAPMGPSGTVSWKLERFI